MTLKTYIRSLTVTQRRELAHRLGVDPNTVYRWQLEGQHGRTPRHEMTLRRIAQATKGAVTLDELRDAAAGV
jgi:DNA-binding transcriptional regulator YdaS (Cro superfamily)